MHTMKGTHLKGAIQSLLASAHTGVPHIPIKTTAPWSPQKVSSCPFPVDPPPPVPQATTLLIVPIRDEGLPVLELKLPGTKSVDSWMQQHLTAGSCPGGSDGPAGLGTAWAGLPPVTDEETEARSKLALHHSSLATELT